MTAGADTLRRLGLKTEVKTDLSPEKTTAFQDLIISAHIPNGPSGEYRYNISAADSEFRQFSIDAITAYIDKVRHFPNLRQVVLHCHTQRYFHVEQPRGHVGEYGLLIDGIRQVGAFAVKFGIEVVLENDTLKWTDIPETTEAWEVDWTQRNHVFGVAPEAWIKVCEDVNRPNVRLCLDGSHLCTYAALFDAEKRPAIAMAYMAQSHLITHVHWNDNYLMDKRGRKGHHVLLGKGSLPREFHKKVKSLNATLLLEHFESVESLEEELDYISKL
ncbi:MAG: TIM barrel protein [SAR202 cluster bacterium]|nr:TIM barrel protein [SAR202 cluster bacterium]